MSFLRLLADVRPTDVWDQGDVLGAAVLVTIVTGSLIAVRVIRRR